MAIDIFFPPSAFTVNPKGIRVSAPKMAGASRIANKDLPKIDVNNFNTQTESGG